MGATIRQIDAPRAANTAATSNRCRLCGIKLGQDAHLDVCLCVDCGQHPRGRAILAGRHTAQARDLTLAEKSLVRSVHAVMQPAQLLGVLNERRSADGGPPVTMEQLREALAELVPAGAIPSGDWASLRKLLAAARRDGTLEQITEQVIDDFATVFSLSPAQWTQLKDTLLQQG